jgi:oligoendopeptidase F
VLQKQKDPKEIGMASEDYIQERWSLDDLYPGIESGELEQAKEALEQMTADFEGVRERLSTDMSEAEFLEILQAYENAVRLLSRMLYYGHLRFAEDTQDQKAQSFLAQVQQRSATFDNRTMFFKLWWKGLEDEQADRLLEVAGDYRYWLEALRLQKPYTLSEPEEKVINLKDVNGPQALVTLYTSFTNRYTFKLEVEGELKELTRDELMVYVRGSDPDLRRAAYQELNRVYGEDAPILGQIYQYRVRDWRSENVELRGYQSPIAVRNLTNDVPDEVVDTLLEACQANAPLFQRYFRLKAKWLGLGKLRRYDVYAPVVKTDKTYPFPEAVEKVLGSFADFEPRFASLAERVFKDKHLDSEVRKHKRSGAFCATVGPDLTPWVLQNYQGRPDNVATLAHELGHAVHSMLADHHTALTQHASLPLAETASTFGEMLLIDRLLEEDPDPEVQRDLLFRQMDDAYATIMRQSYFALFEREAHGKIEAGCSVDELHEVYLENLGNQFGDAIDLSGDFRVEWTAIPHFYHTPFYVYAYAFGQLLVLSLYRQYQQEGEAFKPRYLEILAAGGSDAPARILERAQIDIHSPAFWQGGFNVLEEALERLEAIEIEPA